MKRSKSSRRKKRNEDRISALPEALSHHIASLDMREIVQSSVLSTRWKDVWLSAPNLNFNLNYKGCPTYECGHDLRCNLCQEKNDDFTDFVDKFLTLRGNSNIVKLNLSGEEELENAWEMEILKRHAQHLVLDIYVVEPFPVPDHLFTSSIMVLKLNILHDQSLAQLPNLICSAARIKNLELRSVMLQEGNANAELILRLCH